MNIYIYIYKIRIIYCFIKNFVTKILETKHRLKENECNVYLLPFMTTSHDISNSVYFNIKYCTYSFETHEL